MLRAVLTIAAKDLRLRVRDRSAFLFAVVLPLVLAFIFSQTLGGVTGGSLQFDFAYVDEDGGHIPAALRGAVLGSLVNDGLVELTEARSLAEARQLAADGVVDAAIVVPAGFTQAVTTGASASLVVFGNADSPLGASVAEGIADAFAANLNAVRLSVAAAALEIGEADLEELGRRAAEFQDPVAIVDVSATRKELDLETYFSAGMAVFFLFFAVQSGVVGILDERRDGTMRRLLAAPVPRPAILVGKLLVAFVIGVFSMGVLAVATTYLVGADWGDPLGVALLIVAGVLAATAIMAVVASVVSSSEAASNAQSVVAMVLGMLGGAFFPVAQVGGLMEQASLITPHGWFLRGLANLQGGGGPSDALLPAAAMLAIAAVFGTIAMFRLREALRP